MKTFLLAIFLCLAFFVSPVSAQEYKNEYSKAKVVEIKTEGQKDTAGTKTFFQNITAEILDGNDKGKRVDIEFGGKQSLQDAQELKVGDKIVVVKVTSGDNAAYYASDKYRLPVVLGLTAVFVGLIILFSRLKGFTSILGLGVSILVLIYYIVPSILKGDNPLFVAFSGAVVIACLSLYLAHGVSKRTTIALGSTLITLTLAAILALVSVLTAKLFGTGSEEAYFVQSSGFENLDLRGLLLAGIVIGVLGVLDDITTAQSAAVDEISKANPKLSFKELYKRGISVGREHISSLVNTLVLAYAGASLPLFLLFTINKDQPVWVILNSEFIVEEIVRTLVGSTALIFAVPITTLMAAFFFSKRK